MKLVTTLLAALALTGCATAEYQAYADIHKQQPDLHNWTLLTMKDWLIAFIATANFV